VLSSFQAFPDGEAISEPVAGEFKLPAVVFVLDDADEVAGREARIVESFEDASGGEMAGLFLKSRGFFRTGGWCGRRGILFATPLEDVSAVKAPNGHAGGLDPVVMAEIGASLPAVAGARRWIIEEEEELVEEGDGMAVGILGVLQLMLQRLDSRDFGWR